MSTLTASSLFKPGDTALFSFRHSLTRRADMSTFILDLRYPFGNGLRLSPRIALSSRNNADRTHQWIVEPLLRAIYRWKHRYRLEFEVGGGFPVENYPSTKSCFSAPRKIGKICRRIS